MFKGDIVVPQEQRGEAPNGSTMCSADGALLLCWRGTEETAPGTKADGSSVCGTSAERGACDEKMRRGVACDAVKIVTQSKEAPGEAVKTPEPSEPSQDESNEGASEDWDEEDQLSGAAELSCIALACAAASAVLVFT